MVMVLRSTPFVVVVVVEGVDVVPEAGDVVVLTVGGVAVVLWVPASVRAFTSVSSGWTQDVKAAISAAPVRPIDFKNS